MRLPQDWHTTAVVGPTTAHRIVHRPCGWHTAMTYNLRVPADQAAVIGIAGRHVCPPDHAGAPVPPV